MSSGKQFKSCEYCGRVCEFKSPASAVLKNQKTFVTDITDQIKTDALNIAAKLCMQRAAGILGQTYNPMNMDQRGLAYCIFAHIVSELETDENDDYILQTMQKVKRALVMLLKQAAEIHQDDTEEISGSAPALRGTTANNVEIDSVNNSSLRAQREALRSRRTGSPTKVRDKGVPGELPIGEQILDWMRSDTRFMKIVKDIKKVTGGILVTYDPQTEGYVSVVKVQFAQKNFNVGDELKSITKLRLLTQYDVKYGLDVAMGWGGKRSNKIVARAFPGGIPKDKDELAEAMREVNLKDITDQESLSIILNNDKKLRRAIERLPLTSPLPAKVDNIIAPVNLKAGGDKVKIILEIFFDPRVKASEPFLNVLDILAENLDNLYDIDESKRVQTASQSGLFDFSTKSTSTTDFHFISTGAPIEVKSCPNCGRPFPDPNAEYRRCPHCLFKLM